MKSFSVIIPTLNEEQYILGLLEDIVQQSVLPKEVMVVDGYSTDKTKQLVIRFAKNYPFIRFLHCPANIAAQRNFGAQQATGTVFFFLDADTRLAKNFFQRSLSHLKDHQIACPFYLPFQSNPFIFTIYLFFNLMFFLFQKVSASGAGSCLIVSKKVFTQLKGFNQNVKFEDIELIRRASRHYSFSMLPLYIWVSDRRFRKYGVIKTTIQYLLLSVLFLCNQFNYSVGFSYQFGKYKAK